MRPPGQEICQAHFNGKRHGEPTDRLGFEIITGSEKVLKNLAINAPAEVRDKTDRKIITMSAPRLSQKRLIHTYELNAMRALGEVQGLETLQRKIAIEQDDMRSEFDRTIEFWCSRALRGQIYDSDLTTILVDFAMDATHQPTLLATERWSETTSTPIKDIREWKRLVELDSGHAITGWTAWVGYHTMDALVKHADIKGLLQYQQGPQLLGTGQVLYIAGVTIREYNSTFLDNTDTRRYFIEPNDFILVGEGRDVFDFPFAKVVDEEAPGAVGNPGAPEFYFSKSWVEKDPSGRWIKVEGRPLPVVRRPDAIVRATPLDVPA
jgi:hypothetical protein